MHLVPITDRPSGIRLQGKVVWHDLLTKDIHKAGTFYQKLFGWEIEYRKKYALARNDGHPVAGFFQLPTSSDKERASWIPSFSVESIENSLTSLKQNGGEVINGPVDMGKRGKAALIKDTRAVSAVLLVTAGGDPQDRDAEVGDWLWDEIWTKEPEITKNFYTSLLGYDEVERISDNYSTFTKDKKWRAGIRHIEGYSRKEFWIPVIRVEDPVSTIQQAEELGGRIVIAPNKIYNDGTVALIADTTGAFLLVQRWENDTNEGGLTK